MKHKKYLYSSGEFARINGINKRTLHYYHDIGLFSPAVIGENGYYYYTSFQIVQLELILILRRIGLSIEDIKAYVDSPSDASFAQIVSEKKQMIDTSIRQLLAAKDFLQKKADKLELGLIAEHGKVEQILLPARRILVSAPITGNYDDQDFAVAAEFSMRLKKVFGLYDNFGSRIAVSELRQKNFTQYDRFYAYGQEDILEFDECLPAGTYIRAFCIGGWDKLRGVYEDILTYAEKQNLELNGYAYEEGFNELSLQKSEEYITMITIHCRERKTRRNLENQ